MTTDIVDQSQEHHDYGMAAGHSPVAAKVALVDFDSTIVPWGPLMADADPFPGVPEAMQALRAAGFRIVIFTSRFSARWLTFAFPDVPVEQSLEVQRQHITTILARAGIEFDEITAEKLPAEVYFDDRAIGVTSSYSLDLAIDEFLRTVA